MLTSWTHGASSECSITIPNQHTQPHSFHVSSTFSACLWIISRLRSVPTHYQPLTSQPKAPHSCQSLPTLPLSLPLLQTPTSLYLGFRRPHALAADRGVTSLSVSLSFSPSPHPAAATATAVPACPGNGVWKQARIAVLCPGGVHYLSRALPPASQRAGPPRPYCAPLELLSLNIEKRKKERKE